MVYDQNNLRVTHLGPDGVSTNRQICLVLPPNFVCGVGDELVLDQLTRTDGEQGEWLVVKTAGRGVRHYVVLAEGCVFGTKSDR